MNAKYLSVGFCICGCGNITITAYNHEGRPLFHNEHKPWEFTGHDLVRILQTFPGDNRPGALKVGVLN